jgi:hypothetical protein
MNVLVYWPPTLSWARDNPVRLVIASENLNKARQELAREAGGILSDTTAEIGERIRAELTGEDVTIEKPEQTIRDVTSLQNVSMVWHIQPKTPGPKTLTLDVYNQILVPGATAVEIEQPAYERKINVKIDPLDWLTWEASRVTGLQWLLTVLLLPVFGFLIHKRKAIALILRRIWPRPAKP